MIHNEWLEKETIKTVTCKHTDAAKFLVSNVLTVGKEYEVKMKPRNSFLSWTTPAKLADSTKRISSDQG